MGELTKMKIVLDTDIGNDCDDAGAIAVLCNLKKRYNFDVLAIGSTTPLIDGAQTVNAITSYYNLKTLIGYTCKTPTYFSHDKDLFSKRIAREFCDLKNNYLDTYVKVFRKAYASSNEKITLIIIGPFNAFIDFLKSEPDEISNLTGKELVNSKTKHIYIMGGTFTDKASLFEGNEVHCEWNIVSAIKEAQYFLENVDCEMTFVPFETGMLLTGQELNNEANPVYKSYKYYSNGIRYSWDPITVYYAITKDDKNFSLTDKGIVTIDDSGKTTITYCPSGKHRVLNIKSSKEEVQKVINQYLY